MAESLVGGATAALLYLLRFLFLVARKGGVSPDSPALIGHMPVLFDAFNECKRRLITDFPDPIAALSGEADARQS